MSRANLLAVLLIGIGTMVLMPERLFAAVYSGCEEPVARADARSFYVDPAKGSPRGDGSRAHPWRTLEEVIRDGLFASTPQRRPGAGAVDRAVDRVERATGLEPANSGAPIRGGDTVYLMSGDHGSVLIQGYFGAALVGFNNPSFVTIAAAPGETPVIRQLKILGASKWVFRGLTFESTNNNPTPAMAGSPVKDYFLITLFGPHDNIIIDHDRFLSAPDTVHWTISDWVNKRASGIQDYQGKCIAITNNDIRNIGVGIASQSSTKVLMSNNTIDYFADDGIDYGSSELLIADNRITNSVEDGDGIHRDAMQGQPNTPSSVVQDVTIRHNTVIRLLDRDLAYPAYLQGIDTFDGVWRNVNVVGNKVVTDAGHGISYYGSHQITISDNVLLADSGKVLPCSHRTLDECRKASVVFERTTVPRIAIMHGKGGDPSTDVTIERNITTGIGVDVSTIGSVVRRNLCVPTGGKCLIGIPQGAKMLWAAKPGSYGDRNVIADQGPSALFVRFDPKGLTYDLTLKRNLDWMSK